MKVGSGGNLGLSKEYSKKLFGPMFYSCCNCSLSIELLLKHKSTTTKLMLCESKYLCYAPMLICQRNS